MWWSPGWDLERGVGGTSDLLDYPLSYLWSKYLISIITYSYPINQKKSLCCLCSEDSSFYEDTQIYHNAKIWQEFFSNFRPAIYDSYGYLKMFKIGDVLYCHWWCYFWCVLVVTFLYFSNYLWHMWPNFHFGFRNLRYVQWNNRIM